MNATVRVYTLGTRSPYVDDAWDSMQHSPSQAMSCDPVRLVADAVLQSIFSGNGRALASSCWSRTILLNPILREPATALPVAVRSGTVP